MSSGAARRLTDRQQAVMERIDRRVPIKVIALELGVSETRINQHIRALKDVYDAGSLGELVENYRATLPAPQPEANRDDVPQEEALAVVADADRFEAFSEVAYTKKQIIGRAGFGEPLLRDDPGQLVMSDAMPLFDQAPWLRPGEPRVVPGVLDGEHAVLFRLGAIVAIASGILAAVVLTITAAKTLSDATAGKATISVEQQAAAG
ncbi:MAG: hypothetical protein ACK4RT_11875 [Erythrobacter sp.]